MTQLRLHDRLVVGHLEERARVRLQHDLAGLVQVFMPIQDDVPEETGERGVEKA